MIKNIIFIIGLFSIVAEGQVRDVTFGGNGIVRTQIGKHSSYGGAVLYQQDGKIVVAGEQSDDPTWGPHRFAVVRYLPNGVLDSSFGTNGIATFSLAGSGYYKTAALQSNGKILVAGQTGLGFSIMRITTEGTLDSTFGTNGFVAIGSGAVVSLAVLSDDSIIAGGSDNGNKLAKLSHNGVLDTKFGINGVVAGKYNYNSWITKILVLSDGKLIGAGRTTVIVDNKYISKFFIARYLTNGVLDSTYGSNGILVIDRALNGLALDSNQDLIGVGNIGTNSAYTSGDVQLMKVLKNGTVDTSFGLVVSVDPYADFANAVAIQSDGKILMGGSYHDFGMGGYNCMIIRFLENGQVDNTFGVKGVFKTGVSNYTDEIMDLILTPKNQILITGNANYNGVFEFVTGRINIDITNLNTVDIPANPSITMYPNPVSKFLTINSNNTIDSIELLDVQGRMLTSQIVNEEQSKIDFSTYGTGVYFVKVTSGNGNKIQKIIKK